MKKAKDNSVSVRSFNKSADLAFSILIGLFAFTCIFPFIFVAIISFTSENSLMVNGYSLFPKEWSFDGYKYLYTMKGQLITSFILTIFVTIVGTIINVTITCTYSYALSRRSFKYRKFFTVFALITMLFTAGMVPSYVVVVNLLKLKDTVWALILPLALSPFNIIVMRTFFKKSVPEAIIEAAQIDGAGEMTIFYKIVLPLAVPGIATIGLFATLGYWNNWFNALLYIQKDNLVPLQYLLMKIQNNLDFLSTNSSLGGAITSGVTEALPKEATRMAMVVISTLPIACTYPFFQKYFVTGLTVGGVKE